MEKKIKILAIGDQVVRTGFSRVLENILLNLSPEDFEVVAIGVNYYGDPHKLPYRVYPALTPRTASINDVYGMARLPEIINRELPDIIFILNDAWILDTYLQTLKKTFEKGRPRIVTYSPVDAKDHAKMWYKNFDIVDRIVTYTKFGKSVVEPILSGRYIDIIPHGYDPKAIQLLDHPKRELKRKLYPKNPYFFEDSFVVLNANRNQPRKRLWITMEAFKLFSEKKPENVRLYMHSGIRDSDIDLGEMAVRLGIDGRMHISSLLEGPQQVSEEKLNLIYNACDVGVNTSLGEGWGLCNFEQAVLGVPQILPDNSANTELFGDCGLLVKPVMDEILTGIMTRGSTVRPEDVAEKLEMLYGDSGLYTSLSLKSRNKFAVPEYQWPTIAKTWEILFKEVAG